MSLQVWMGFIEWEKIQNIHNIKILHQLWRVCLPVVNPWLAWFCTGISSTYLIIENMVSQIYLSFVFWSKKSWPVLAVSIARSHPGSSRDHHCHPDRHIMDMIQNNTNVENLTRIPATLFMSCTHLTATSIMPKVLNRYIYPTHPKKNMLPSLCKLWSWCLYPCAKLRSLQSLWRQLPLPAFNYVHNNLLCFMFIEIKENRWKNQNLENLWSVGWLRIRCSPASDPGTLSNWTTDKTKTWLVKLKLKLN